MAKKWTDAEFTVVGAARRKELPGWFRAGMVLTVAAWLLATAFWRAGGLGNEHSTAPPAPVAGQAGPATPTAR
jgi:hypothetical protein